MNCYTLFPLFLLPAIIVPVSFAQDTSSPCEKKVDEFKEQVTITCPDAEVRIQQQPESDLLVSSIALGHRDGQNTIVFTTGSDSWNFLDVDTAYMIVDDKNLEFDLLNTATQTQNGSVIEQNVITLTDSELRRIAEAESFRIKIGRAVFYVTGYENHAEYLLSQ